MNALYSDLVVTLMKISFNSLPSSTNKDIRGSGGLSKELDLLDKKRHLREKSLLVRFMVTGNARMSGGINEWEVYVLFDTSAARDNRTRSLQGIDVHIFTVIRPHTQADYQFNTSHTPSGRLRFTEQILGSGLSPGDTSPRERPPWGLCT